MAGTAAPLTYEQLINAIAGRHPSMSKRFRQIAQYVVQNPNDVALESVKTIATAAGVQPSSLVRFAQTFDFAGFSEMQRVFQARLLTAAPGFSERLDALKREVGHAPASTSLGFVRDLALRDIAALQHLHDTLTQDDIEHAVMLLAEARTVYVIGQLRAYPVANYLRYVLTHLRRDVRLMDGAGGLAAEQAQMLRPDCLLLAISFRHYAREVVDIVEATAQNGLPVVAITDSQLSPLAKHATVCLEVPAGEHNFAVSLAAPMCLAQALVIGMAHALDVDPASVTPLRRSAPSHGARRPSPGGRER